MDVGTVEKGKAEDDLDSFSTVFLDLPTINAQLTFVKWRQNSGGVSNKKHFQEKDTVCLDGVL